MKKIKLTGKLGGFALVDNRDYPALNQHKWYQNYQGYAVRGFYKNGKRQSIIRMHRVIMDTPTGFVTDHINHDTLDNRRSNLRICTHAENIANSRPRKTPKSSLFKGVYIDKRRNTWNVELKFNNKRHRFSGFASEKEAALFYNIKAKEIFGKYAALNVII